MSADPSDDQERVLSLAGSKESLLLQTLRGGKYSNRPPSPLVATGPHDAAAPREHSGGLLHRTKAFDQQYSDSRSHTKQGLDFQFQQHTPLNPLFVPKLAAITSMTTYQDQLFQARLLGTAGTVLGSNGSKVMAPSAKQRLSFDLENMTRMPRVGIMNHQTQALRPGVGKAGR